MVWGKVQTQTNTKMRNNITLGAFYVALFMLIIPGVVGGIVDALYWARNDSHIQFWVWTVFGLIGSALTALLLTKNIYIVNPAYTCSFWLDPFFSKKGIPDHERLIVRGPGFHFRFFWEQFDSTTEHEKEVSLPLKGKFETFGEDLNLEINGGLMVLKLPMTSAQRLRSIAKGMDDIREELEKQLTPALVQATATIIAKYDSEHILKNQADIAREIRERFEEVTQINTKYGTEGLRFSLGDVGFSETINNAREEKYAATKDAEAAKAWQDNVDGDLDPKDAADLVMMGKKGVEAKIHRISGLTDSAAGAFGAAAAAFSKKSTK
jgi:regulator of protease activity HflC (stomatin/prohibitin superfamily)